MHEGNSPEAVGAGTGPGAQVERQSPGYLAAMERLVGVVQQLSQALDLDAVAAIVRDAARNLTGADGATLVLRDRDQCFYAEENAIAPLWKGKRFPMSACISGWVMQHATPAVIEDIYSDPRVPLDAYRPTFVKSLVMVPIRRESPIGAIGNYWAQRRRPTDEELKILQALADTTSVAIKNVEMYTRLHEHLTTLEAHERRIREQRDTLEVFTRALAHDLREPARMMSAFSQLLGDTSEHASLSRDEYLSYIRGASRQMGLTIDSVFEYLQLEETAADQRRPCDAGTVVQAAARELEPLVRERGASIEHTSLPVVHAVPRDLHRLFKHIIDNAIRHNDAPVTVRVEAHEQGDLWHFTITDNGRGVAPDAVEKIFLPFKRLTSRPNCVGLGLATCAKIVTQHGGAIWCEPARGSGAVFCFTLPKITVAGSTPDLAVARAASPRAGPGRHLASMLVVDDLPGDLELVRLMIEHDAHLNCRLLFAKGGEEALNVLRQQAVDLMLLDINMPGMDGFEVLEQIRQDRTLAHLPVILCTGSTHARDRARSVALGASDYLVKPPTFDNLRPMLETIPNLKLHQDQGGWCLTRAAGEG